MIFNGLIVALVTPFCEGGTKIDEERLKKLVNFHIKSGTDAILTSGTTGESATLDYAEHERVTELCVKASDGRIPIIAGTGSNSTDEAVMLTRHAKKSGADGCLLVSPYYNKPTQEGLYLHFKAIAKSVPGFPVMLYNISSRTGINIEPMTTARLVNDCKNITAIKEASGNLDQMSRTISLCGRDFTLLSGDDALTLPVLSIGGVGVVSVVANIIPKDVKALICAFQKKDMKNAQKLHHKMLPLIKTMFIETNPIPVKTAMGLLNLCSPDLRLPMCAITKPNLAKLKKALKSYSLI